MTTTAESLRERLLDLEAAAAEVASAADVDTFFIIVMAVLVFLMQVGFAMLEVGSVSPKNTKAVLLKNIADVAVGALSWWLVGNAIALGPDAAGGFAGGSGFAMVQRQGTMTETHPDGKALSVAHAEWTFGMAFAATTATIVSGAIAERVKILAYCTFAVFICSFIYPVVAHWGWSTGGWASPHLLEGGVEVEEEDLLLGCGAVDFAGGLIVHAVGGMSALVAAVIAGPRTGRFGTGKGTVNRMPQQSPALQTLGILFLWIGWFGFNGGSSLRATGMFHLVNARAMVSTTIAPAAGFATQALLVKLAYSRIDLSRVNNGVLAGLVGVTAGAPLLEPEGAFVVGVVSSIAYFGSSALLRRYRVDDVVDAAPVHLFCGMWGAVAAALFATRDNYAAAYGDQYADRCCGLFYGCPGNQLAANLVFALAVNAWAFVTSAAVILGIKGTIGLRVPLHVEHLGLDRSACRVHYYYYYYYYYYYCLRVPLHVEQLGLDREKVRVRKKSMALQRAMARAHGLNSGAFGGAGLGSSPPGEERPVWRPSRNCGGSTRYAGSVSSQAGSAMPWRRSSFMSSLRHEQEPYGDDGTVPRFSLYSRSSLQLSEYSDSGDMNGGGGPGEVKDGSAGHGGGGSNSGVV